MFRFSVVTLIVAAGCLPVPDIAGRLDVTSELRAACPGYSDAEIGVYISAIESDRLGGHSYADEILHISQECVDWECPCAMAVADQVYNVR